MMSDFEKDLTLKYEKNEDLPKKLDISMLKYFWQASPFVRRKDTYPKFLRKIEVLKNFSDNELRVFSKYLHVRNFREGEVIFSDGNLGVGFYFIFSGHVDIISKDSDESNTTILTLESLDYFGELALLQENSLRNATAVCKGQAVLLGIFKPDVDELIEVHPVIAAKLLQSISMIVANRLFSVTQELKLLKHKNRKLEEEHG